MSHFYKGEYRGLRYDVYPLDFRRVSFFRSYPYLVGDKVKLHIKVTKIDKTRDTRLNTVAINARFPDGVVLEMQEHHRLPDDATEITIESLAIPSSGALEYWLDVPPVGDAQKLADLQGNWKDQIWLMLLAALIGFAVGLAGQYLLSLTQQLLGK